VTHDFLVRRVNGQPESLRWQPTRRRREKKLRSAFRSGQQIDVGPNGNAARNGQRPPRRAVVRGEVIAAILCGESGPRNIVRLTLRGARVTGRLDLSYARIEHPITLQDCVFDQPIVLAEARLGALTLDGSTFPGIEATNVEIDGDLALSRIRSSRTLRITGAHLHRDLCLRGAHLHCGEGQDEALAADHLMVNGSVACDGLEATGPVIMADARVSGAVGLRKATIIADGGRKPAFDGDGMTVGHDFSAAGLRTEGEVTLVDVRVAGVLDLGKATLTRPGDVALRLDRAEVSGSLYCNAGFTVTGSMDAIGAHVHGSFYLNRAELGKPPVATDGAARPAEAAAEGAALRLVRTRIDGDLGCWKGFVAHRTLDMRRSSVGGEVSLLTTGLNGHPVAADLSNGRFATLRLAGDEPTGFLDFTRAKADFFRDGPAARWPRGNIILDEFEYGAIPMNSVTLKEREEWLRRAMAASRRRSGGAHDGYLPQPYDQLAAAYRRAGDDHSARRIELAKYRQRNRVTGWRRRSYSKLWNIVQDAAIGYGYEPWRALLWLGVLLVAGVLLFRYVGAVRPYSIVTVQHHRPLTFTLNNSVSYTLDLLLPTSGLEARQAWQSNGPGEVAAAFLVAFGLLLTATVFAAAARVLQRK
jgi:hypothetical protein